IGYEKKVAVLAEGGTCRKQQTLGHAVLKAVEVAEFGNGLAGGVYHHDLIGLIGRYPKVIGAVENESVGTVDAVREHLRRHRLGVWCCSALDSNFDDPIHRGIGHE